MTTERDHPALRWALLVAAAVLLAIPFLPLGSNRDSPLMRAVFDAGHFPLFAVLTAVSYVALGAARPIRRLWIAIAIGAASALVVELVQPWIGRTSSFRDFLIGFLGVFTTATGIWVWRRSTVAMRWAHFLIVAALAVVVLRPTCFELQATLLRQRQFPLLADFEDPIELRLWTPRGHRLAVPSTMTLSTERSSSGTTALEIKTARGQYGGARYTAGRQNWDDYETLAFDLYNPGEPFSLLIRVDDSGDCTEHESRFNRRLTARPGWETVRIAIDDIRNGPERRELNMEEITRVIFLAHRSPSAKVFLLDHVRLE